MAEKIRQLARPGMLGHPKGAQGGSACQRLGDERGDALEPPHDDRIRQLARLGVLENPRRAQGGSSCQRLGGERGDALAPPHDDRIRQLARMGVLEYPRRAQGGSACYAWVMSVETRLRLHATIGYASLPAWAC